MSRLRLTAGFVAEATGGRLLGAEPGLELQGVATDTRRAMEGACFIALRGPRHDAHDHLAAARAAGASLALVDRDVSELPRVLVDDTRVALGRLAAAWRLAIGVPVIAITGSVGKTTSKELLRSILAARGPVAAAPSSWNNDVGLPLTLLSARAEHEALVAEIGTGAPGEIRALSEIARPDLAIITAVGHAHLGAFGSVEAIATEKASIVDPMDPAAPVVANRDAPYLIDRLAGRPGVVWYGRDPTADVRVLDSGAGDDGPWCEVDRGGGCERFGLQLNGEHNALNAGGAIAAAGVLAGIGPAVDDEALRRGLAAAATPSMRLTQRTIGGVHVHDDSWNASPESMVASLRTFDVSTRAAVAAGGRRILVLGDMLELGPDAPRLHRDIGQLVQELDLAAPFAALILIGRHAPLIGAGRDLAARSTVLDRLDTGARTQVLGALRPGDHVLLKGSRGIGLERVAAWLDETAAATAAARTTDGR